MDRIQERQTDRQTGQTDRHTDKQKRKVDNNKRNETKQKERKHDRWLVFNAQSTAKVISGAKKERR